MRILLVFIVLAVVVLGYGWYHARTHASFHIDFRTAPTNGVGALTKNDGNEPQHNTANAKVVFMNARGETLAEGVNDVQYNFVHLIHPTLADCHKEESQAVVSRRGRSAWQKCYRTLSKWTAGWVRQVRQVTIAVGDCEIGPLPAEASKYYTDWYLWWVPLPHIGGTPYSHYRLTIALDINNCNATEHRSD